MDASGNLLEDDHLHENAISTVNSNENCLSLMKSLLNEFGEQFSAAEVCCQLCSKRPNKNETLIEYLYAIIEVGSKIYFNDMSLIE